MSHPSRQWSVFGAILLASVSACDNGPPTVPETRYPPREALTATTRQSLAGGVTRIAPNVYAYTGQAADSFLTHLAARAAAAGDFSAFRMLEVDQPGLRTSVDPARRLRPTGPSRVIADGDPAPPPPPPTVISPENTGPAVIYSASMTPKIVGTTGTVLGTSHFLGMSIDMTATYSASSATSSSSNIASRSDTRSVLGDNAFSCLGVATGTSLLPCTFDENASAVWEIRDMPACGMTLTAGGAFVAYWGFPNGNNVQTGGPIGVSVGTWGHSPTLPTFDKTDKNADCTSPSAVITLSDAGNHTHTATKGGTLDATAPEGGRASVVLDAAGSNPGNSPLDSYKWAANGVDITSSPTASSMAWSAPIGSTTITLTVKNKVGLTSSASATVKVTVASATPPDDGSGGGGGGSGDGNPPPPSDTPPDNTPFYGPDGALCYNEYYHDTWFDYNTMTGGETWTWAGIKCIGDAATNRLGSGNGWLSMSMSAGSTGGLSATAAPGRRLTLALADSLPQGRAFALVRRALSGNVVDVLLVSRSSLTEDNIDVIASIAGDARIPVTTSAKDLVYVPKVRAPVLSDAVRRAVARGILIALQHAPLVDVAGFGRKQAITIDLGTRSVVP